MIREILFRDYQDWLQKRKQFIGGSDAAAVIGLNPYCSPYTLWAEKTGKIPSFQGNLATEVGKYLEGFVAATFTAETGKRVRRKNRILHNDAYPWAIANIDRMVIGERALLEIKTTTSLPNMRLFRNGEYPAQWYCQVMHYLAVTGLSKGYLAVLISNRDFQLFEIQRDKEEIATLMEAEQAFFQLMQNNTPPAIDGMSSTKETLNTVYHYATPNSEVDITPMDGHIQQYFAFSRQIAKLKELQEAEANAVRSYLGQREQGKSSQFKVSWKNQVRKTFDDKAYLKDNPFDQAKLAPYYKESVSRVLRISER